MKTINKKEKTKLTEADYKRIASHVAAEVHYNPANALATEVYHGSDLAEAYANLMSDQSVTAEGVTEFHVYASRLVSSRMLNGRLTQFWAFDLMQS